MTHKIFQPQKIGIRLIAYTFIVVLAGSLDFPLLSGATVFLAIMDLLHVLINKIFSSKKSADPSKEKASLYALQANYDQLRTETEKSNMPAINLIDLAKAESQLAKFNTSEKICATSQFSIETGIAFDFEGLEICVYSFALEGGRVKQSIISFPIKDLLSIDIIENGFSLSQSTTTTQGTTTEKTAGLNMLGRAALGGVLFGGVGAVIGGLSARKTGEISTTSNTNTQNKQMISDVSLKLLINDTKTPIINLKFIYNNTEKNSMQYKSAYQKIEQCDALLRVMINRAASLNN